MNHKEALQYIKEEVPGLFASNENGKTMSQHPKLEELFTEWIDPRDKFLAVSVSSNRGNIIVVTESSNKTGTMFSYNVIRIFPAGNTWHLSMDKDHKSLPEVIDHLVQ